MSIQLNKEQLDAVKFRGKHLLVLAGAGTGKTQTIISRANYLIEHGVSPSRILILSFTRKSAQEIVERIKAVSFKKSGISNLVGRTFHSWCMDIIKNNPDIFQHHNYSVIDREDQEGAFRFLCGKNYKDSDNKRISPVKLIDVYSYSINTKCSLTESIRVKAYDNQKSEEVYETIGQPLFEAANQPMDRLNTQIGLLDIQTQTMYMHIEIEGEGSSQFGLKFKMDNNGKYSSIYYDNETKEIVLDTRYSGNERVARIVSHPMDLTADETLSLEIFIDHSMVEIYINGEKTMTASIYNVGTGVEIISNINCYVHIFNMYEIKEQ